MFFLNAFIWLACMFAVGFAVMMTVWIWRTRPGASYGPRRTDPLVAARVAALTLGDAPRIPTGGPALGRGGAAATAPPTMRRRSVDGRARDLSPWSVPL